MNIYKVQIERDCTDKCKSKQQANDIVSVLTKRSITDLDICAYLNWKCVNCGFIFDSEGRTALHFAASCGRKKVTQWLIRNKSAPINIKDLESGYTALHRSLFYGKINIAVSLIHLGANINILDNDDLTALDHAIKDRTHSIECNNATPCQVYVWGTNTNYTLGTGSQHSPQYPELLDSFHRKQPNVSVKQICLDKFHSILVAIDGTVFSCGHGHGGRLGLGTESTVLEPQVIKFSVGNSASFVCSQAAVGRDHTLFLSENGQIWSCGLNTHHVLGLRPPPPQIVVPRLLADMKHAVTGVCASRYHSVAWNSTAIYTWGLHAGQLGHDKGPQNTQTTPKLVTYFSTPNNELVSVATSDGATVVATKKGNIYALHEYQCRKIASKQLNIVKIVVIGGHLNSKVSSELSVERRENELKVLVLTSIGNLLIWQESYPQLSRCIYNMNRSIIVKDVILNRSELLFVTEDGQAFKGELRTRKKKLNENTLVHKNAFNEFLDKDDCQMIKITKFSHIHRAVKIQSDLKGRNYAVLQVDPCFNLIDVPQISECKIRNDMLSLLRNSDEMDSVHDVKFKINKRIFPVHRYIIAQRSEPLELLIQSHASQNPIEIQNVDPSIFQQILLYIYTGQCNLLTLGECPENLKNLTIKKKQDSNIIESSDNFEDDEKSAYEYYSNKNKNSNKPNPSPSDPIRLLQEAAKRFGIKNLYKKLDGLIYDNGYIRKKTGKISANEKFTFDRSFKNMHDVIINTKNGKEILAHKCILSARLEYFNNIFAVRWNMNSTRNAVTMPLTNTVLEPVIEFLYTDECKQIEKCNDIDFICNLLIVSDQLFIERLKEMCEVTLSSLITLKNAAQILQFGSIYNAKQLKSCAMEYICLNLSAILESKVLEDVDDKILEDLTEYYCSWNSNMSTRIITPFSEAPSDDIVKSISDIYPIYLKFDDSDHENDSKLSKTNMDKKKKNRTKKNSWNVSENKNKVKEEESNLSEKIDIVKEDVFEKKEVENEKWVKILSEKQKHEKIIKARLKAVATAKEEMNLPLPENYKLSKTPRKNIPNKSNSPIHFPTTSPKYYSPVSPKNYSISPDSSFSESPIKSPSNYEIPIVRAPKLSQKQRKKLTMDSNAIAEQLNKVNLKSNLDQDFATPIVSPGPSTKNPWKKMEISAPMQINTNENKFVDIVAGEKKQKENWSKMKSKPLIYTQMEDKAIEELIRFYNAEECAEEYITVHRVDTGQYAAPLWVHNKTNK